VISLAVMFLGVDRRSPDEYPTRRYD
jgi:hypothetical protein